MSSNARETLIAELREHALVLGEVTLSSGATAQYYVDARRALLRPAGFRAAGELIADGRDRRGAEAVGGPVMAAIPLACAAIAVPEATGWSASSSARRARRTASSGWSRARSARARRSLVVEDTVTTGGSTIEAIGQMR